MWARSRFILHTPKILHTGVYTKTYTVISVYTLTQCTAVHLLHVRAVSHFREGESALARLQDHCQMGVVGASTTRAPI